MHGAGFRPEQILDHSAADPDPEEFDEGTVSDEVHRARFGEWFAREEEFFTTCYRLVAAMTPAEATAVCGVRSTIRRAELADRLATLQLPRLPDPLQRNPGLQQRREPTGHVVVVSFFDLQPIRLKPDVLAAMDEFDGRTPTEQVLARIEASHGFTLSSALLIRMHQLRVLVDPKDQGGGRR